MVTLSYFQHWSKKVISSENIFYSGMHYAFKICNSTHKVSSFFHVFAEDVYLAQLLLMVRRAFGKYVAWYFISLTY